MRGLALALALAAVGCAPPPSEVGASPASASGSPAPEPLVSPSPAAAPATPEPTPEPSPAVRLDAPAVEVSGAIPIVRSLTLVAQPIDANVEGLVRDSITRHLLNLNAARDNGRFTLPGKFGEAVAAGIRDSATPGVARRFELVSFRIDRLMAKPWGTRAVAEVTATIADRAVDRNAPDQFETGRLRLVGDRLFVVDGWDYAAGRWFNGYDTVSSEEIRWGVGQAVGWMLRSESWVPGSPLETNYSSSVDVPYFMARSEYVRTLERASGTARRFVDVTARVERYETFSEIRDGLATVRVTGTLITVDATGTTSRRPIERRIVVLFGNWTPQVVDEEVSPGAWMSGGNLALKLIDVNAA